MHSYYIFELEDGTFIKFQTGGTDSEAAREYVEAQTGQKATLWKNATANHSYYGNFPYIDTRKDTEVEGL